MAARTETRLKEMTGELQRARLRYDQLVQTQNATRQNLVQVSSTVYMYCSVLALQYIAIATQNTHSKAFFSSILFYSLLFSCQSEQTNAEYAKHIKELEERLRDFEQRYANAQATIKVHISLRASALCRINKQTNNKFTLQTAALCARVGEDSASAGRSSDVVPAIARERRQRTATGWYWAQRRRRSGQTGRRRDRVALALAVRARRLAAHDGAIDRSARRQRTPRRLSGGRADPRSSLPHAIRRAGAVTARRRHRSRRSAQVCFSPILYIYE